MTRRVPRLCLSVLGALSAAALAGCLPPKVPGWGPLLVPDAPIVPEPTHCGQVGDPVRTSNPDAPIVGAADLHIHQFADLGFGGRIVWGKSFSPKGIEDALSACGNTGMCADEKELALCTNLLCQFAPDRALCREGCETRACSALRPHGHYGVTDPIGAVLGQGYGHRVDGNPRFVGWPHYSSSTHQQVYHRWLRRAFDGGVKLIVMMAVSNETLCKFLGSEHSCDDMDNAKMQLEAAIDLQNYIDEQDDCVPNGSGWYRIARTPEEARRIIASGGMAVVLGIEVDTLFGCRPDGGCTPESLKATIDDYYNNYHVRHVFPVHVLDNGFGGAAAYNDFFNFGNLVVNHKLFTVRDCSAESYAFQFGKPSTAADLLMSKIADAAGVKYERYPEKKAHCNALGLTDLGKSLIGDLMADKMIIDLDHMSAKMRADVIAQTIDPRTKGPYAGLVVGHTGFQELYRGEQNHEGQLGASQADDLARRGGVMAPILHQGSRADLKEYTPAGKPRVPHDCGYSVKSFVQGYRYAVEKAHGGGVGFGSDMNGLAGLPTPRFGPYACGGDGEEQHGRVSYPVALYRNMGPPMHRSQAGSRVFDINVDGYAHVGMFPDFVAELRAVGLSDDDLAPLFGSAEAYISMWECVEAPDGEACARSRSRRSPVATAGASNRGR